MYITCRNANEQDANLLVGIYNAAFYDDFIRYGQCPAYGRTRARMAESVRKFPKQIIDATADRWARCPWKTAARGGTSWAAFA